MELGLLFTTLLVSQWLEAEMHLRLESQPEVSYFFPFFFCSANNFFTIRLHVRGLQRRHRHQYQQLDEQGTRDACVSSPR